MAKQETTITNLKINRGTYEAIQANLSQIGENELIITTDKNVPIPGVNDAGKIIKIDSSGDYELSAETDTWRNIKVNGTEKLGTGTNTGALDLQQGTNVSITESSGVVTISATDTTYSLATTSSNGLLRQLESSSVSTQTQSTKFLREDGTWAIPSYTTISVSATGSSTDEVQYITINGVEKKIAGVDYDTDSLADYVEELFLPHYDITMSVTYCTYTGNTSIPAQRTKTITITPNTGYFLPSTITINGVTGTSGSTDVTWSYDNTTGVITLTNATDDLSIMVICNEDMSIH